MSVRAATTVLGHAVELDDESREWRWSDTSEPVTHESILTRPCVRCDRTPTPGGHDACLGELPGVSHACCGHGDLGQAYVVIGGQPNQPCRDIDNRRTLRESDALTFFRLLDAGPEP